MSNNINDWFKAYLIMLNVILLHSPNQRTGKTYLSDYLLRENIVQQKLSFALPIKQDSYFIHQQYR